MYIFVMSNQYVWKINESRFDSLGRFNKRPGVPNISNFYKNKPIVYVNEDRASILEFMTLVVLEQTDTLKLVIQALDYFDKFKWCGSHYLMVKSRSFSMWYIML